MSQVSPIFEDGSLVDLDVSYWSGAKALKPKDLGMTEEQVSQAYSLGRKKLVPSEVTKAFRSVESRARRAADINGFKIGHARFVPKSLLPEVEKTLKECRKEYMAMVDDLIAKYPEYRNAMIPVYKEAAEQAYINQSPEQHTFGPDYDREAEKQQFVEKWMQEQFYYQLPDPETLRKKYSMSWLIYAIAEPQSGASEMLQDKLSGLVDDVVTALRQQTIEVCTRVTESLQEGRIIRGKTLSSLKEFINRFKAMNFVGDTVVEEELQKLHDEIINVYPTTKINEESELQEEFKRRLSKLADIAKNTSDVSSVTGEYRRKIMWSKNGC